MVPPTVCLPYMHDAVMTAIICLSFNRGMTPLEAMTAFLDISSRFDFYGMIFFEVKVRPSTCTCVCYASAYVSKLLHY